MKLPALIPIVLGWVLCSGIGIDELQAQASQAKKNELVLLGYEITLKKCAMGKCSEESAIKDQRQVSLESENDASTGDAMGFVSRVYSVGNTAYYVRLLASHDRSGRHFLLGFSGRQGTTPHDRQVTYAEKSFNNARWTTFPVMVAEGTPFSDAGLLTTPRLVVKVLPGD